MLKLVEFEICEFDTGVIFIQIRHQTIEQVHPCIKC